MYLVPSFIVVEHTTRSGQERTSVSCSELHCRRTYYQVWAGKDEGMDPTYYQVWAGKDEGMDPTYYQVWAGKDEGMDPTYYQVWAGKDEGMDPTYYQVWAGKDEGMDPTNSFIHSLQFCFQNCHIIMTHNIGKGEC